MTATRVGMAGAAALVVGGALLGTSIAASAAGPTLSVAPNTVSSTAIIGIVPTGSGYPSKTTGAGLICPIVAGEPTVVLGSLGSWPVGCETYSLQSSAAGALKSTSFPLVSGKVIASWGATTTDSSGGNANKDALNYPVPPYADEHGTVEVYATFGASASVQGSAALTFSFVTTGSTTTSSPTTTSTTAPCKAVSKTASATTGKGTVTVDPATCLVNGTVVNVTATGLTAKDTGSVLECNTDKSQPTVLVFDVEQVPVSCSSVAADVFSTGTGDYSTKFTVAEGVVGPPGTGTDTAGNSASADAAKYPCPPTAAQIAAGDQCVIAVGDEAVAPSKVGDQIAVPISFNTNKGATSPPTTPTTASSATTTGGSTATTSGATTTSSSSLAFTGTGPGVWWLGLIGIMLMLLGGLLLLLAGPRLVFARAVHTSSRVLRRKG